MRSENILVRRYFHPLISQFPMYRGLPSSLESNLPVAQLAASQVLCLPIHPDLSDAEVDMICSLTTAQARVRAA